MWPLALVALGVWLLIDRSQPQAPEAISRFEAGEMVDAFVVWGGMERAVTSTGFRGGEATAIMGGIELDLRQAKLAPGEQHLRLTAVMGGVEIRVPEDWQVVVEGTPLMGDIEDSRKPAATTAAEAGAADARLLVHAFAVMGGVEVKT